MNLIGYIKSAPNQFGRACANEIKKLKSESYYILNKATLPYLRLGKCTRFHHENSWSSVTYHKLQSSYSCIHKKPKNTYAREELACTFAKRLEGLIVREIERAMKSINTHNVLISQYACCPHPKK